MSHLMRAVRGDLGDFGERMWLVCGEVVFHGLVADLQDRGVSRCGVVMEEP